MITALVVDDEPRAVARLAQLLEQSGTIDVIGTAASVDDAERFLKGRVPDVVFLDIDMPGRLGVDLVAGIPAGTKVVFVTAHDGHAVDAFRHGALDYVLKPFDEDRLAITLGRLAAATLAAAPPADGSASRPEAAAGAGLETVQLTFDSGRRVEIVSCDDVVWIEAVQNYTRVQTGGRQPAVVRRTLQEWDDQLGSNRGFHRLGRSLIIRLPALRSTQWQSRDQTLLFFSGVAEPLPIGRTAATRLRQLLEDR